MRGHKAACGGGESTHGIQVGHGHGGEPGASFPTEQTHPVQRIDRGGYKSAASSCHVHTGARQRSYVEAVTRGGDHECGTVLKKNGHEPWPEAKPVFGYRGELIFGAADTVEEPDVF